MSTPPAPIRPEFIRLPKPGTLCPFTGYSRSGLANITVPSPANNFRPEVPAKCDRRRGTTRGIWLIPYDALIAFIKALPCDRYGETPEQTAAHNAARIAAEAGYTRRIPKSRASAAP